MKADMTLGVKRCSKCQSYMSIEMFNKNKAMSDGLSNWCRSCMLVYYAERRSDPAVRDAERERKRRRYRENPKRFYEGNRKRKLQREFGITVEEFDRMFAAQGSRCAICGTDDFGGAYAHVDHCHQTGLVRGLLCVRCNQGLGFFKDDPDRMRAAIAYLEAFLGRLLRAA